MRASALPAALLLAAAAAASGPATQPATAPAEAEKLLAECLAHDARSLGHLRRNSVVGRAGRILALLGCAERLCPQDPQTNRQLVALYEELGDLKKAAEAARRYVRTCPGDYAIGVRMVRLSQAPLDDADQRVALLKEVSSDAGFLDEVRAFAAAELAGVYRRQADRRSAQAAFRTALSLDPLELAALQLSAEFDKEAVAAAGELRLALKAVEANPRSVTAAWDVARLLQAAGLPVEAVEFYRHAEALLRIKRLPAPSMEKIVVDSCNALLDAGRAHEVAKLFEPLIRTYSQSRGLRALMIEAHRELGNAKKVKVHLEALRSIYRPLMAPTAKLTGKQAAELAWFHLIFAGTPEQALSWAKRAALSAGDDTSVQLALGAAQLAMGSIEDGTKRLTGLLAKEPYAAAILARHHFKGGDGEGGRKVLRKGVGGVRSGPGFRALAALARDKGVELPLAPHAEALREVLKTLPRHVLEMGRDPRSFLTLTLLATRPEVRLGEPVTVTLELANVSSHPVPLGQGGLFNPIVYLGLAIEGDAKAELPALTPVRLPAPKYLRPGAKVSVTARVDVGPAEEVLMANPLGELRVTVIAMLDPLQDGGRLFSSVPEIPVSPARLVRKPLFSTAGKKLAAQYALGYIVRDLKQGDLAAKLRAARQTASLLGHVRRREVGTDKEVFPDVLTKPILLSMTRAFLRAESPAIRAGMLAALHHVELDRRIIALLGPLVDDPAPAVRMRLIELLAVKRTPGRQTLLDHFAQDRDRLVREMAAAVRGSE